MSVMSHSNHSVDPGDASEPDFAPTLSADSARASSVSVSLSSQQQSPVSSKQLHHQIKNFHIELSSTNTISDRTCRISNKMITVSTIIAMIMFIVRFIIYDMLFPYSLYYSIFVALYFTYAFSIFILKCNLYILIRGLTYFATWYKLIHASIGFASLAVLLNSDAQNVSIKNHGVPIRLLENILNGLVCVNAFLGILALCVSDGLRSKNSKAKMVALSLTMIGFLFYWCQIYFNMFNFDINKSFTINWNIFGVIEINDTFYWRSICLSSLFKCFVFLMTQTKLALQRPNRMNLFALPVKINFINVNFSDSDSNDNVMRIESVSVTNSQLNSDNDENENEIERNIDSNNGEIHESKNHDFSIDFFIEKTIFYEILKYMNGKYNQWFGHDEIQVKKEILVEYSLKFCNKWVVLVLYSITLICTIIRAVFVPYSLKWIKIPLDIIIFIGSTSLLLNLNALLFSYRKKSFLLIWKLYNIVTLWITICLLRYYQQSEQFNPKYYSLIESILTSILIIMCQIILTIYVSLHQGFYENITPKWIKSLTLILIILTYMYYCFYHFINDDLDNNIYFLGQYFSLRSIIVSKSSDLVVWFSYSFYQIVMQSQELRLVSRIGIKWI